jgi:hypothetical protein
MYPEESNVFSIVLIVICVLMIVAMIGYSIATAEPPKEDPPRCFCVTCPDISGEFLVFKDEETYNKQCSNGLYISMRWGCVWEEIPCSECEYANN